MKETEPLELVAARFRERISKILADFGWKIIGVSLDMRHRAQRIIDSYESEPYRVAIIVLLGQTGEFSSLDLAMAWSRLQERAEAIEPESPSLIYQAVAAGLSGEYELLREWGIELGLHVDLLRASQAERIRWRWNEILDQLSNLAGLPELS